MRRVGLTGGIACGKSYVVKRLAARGIPVLDLDALAHAVLARGGAAYERVVGSFGPGILASDAAIDRKALAAAVFADPSARARLEAIVHPCIRAEESRRAGALEAEGRPLLVSDGALLIEAGAHLRFDRLVVVHCRPEQQLSRLVARDLLDETAAQARLAAQMPIGQKRRFAHAEVDTSGSLEQTDLRADALAAALGGFVAAPGLRARPPLVAVSGVLAAARRGPRGLEARVVLEQAADSGGLELARLARRLQPPVEGPWYGAARSAEGPPWPEALAPALALWAAIDGRDDEWLAGAAASLARLTHDDPEAVAGGVLAARAALALLAGESLSTVADRLAGWSVGAARWGGAEPPGRVRAAVRAAAAGAGDGDAAPEIDPAFLGGLRSLAGRPGPSVPHADESALARRLAS